MTDQEERPRPWRWPGNWFRDEAFWRSVTAMSMSASMTTGIAFLAARFAGLFAEVPWSTVCKTLVTGTVLVPLLGLLVLLAETGYLNAERRIKRRLLRRSGDLRANLDDIRSELDKLQAAGGGEP
jgi:hypothetical protein